MRHVVGSLLMLSVVMSACAPTPAVRTVTPKASVKPVVSSPTSRPSAKPSPTLLAGPTALLKGTISIDAHYIVSSNAGSIVANNGGSVIALKAGSLISDNGLGLISDNGLGLISDNGLGLIANSGGGLASRLRLGFRVLATDVAVGTMLPVKGMAVFPIAMRSGEIVGKPVLTDAQGRYALAVPEAVKGNIRLVARVPVAKQDDPIAQDTRMQYNLVVESGAGDRVIDEDTSIATRYLRACFASRLTMVLVATKTEEALAAVVQELGLPKELEGIMSGTVLELNQAGRDVGAPTLPPAGQLALGQRVTDITLSYMALADVLVDPAKYGQTGPQVNAVAAMADVMNVIRTAATAKMKADPAYFDNQGWVKAAQWSRTIKKPSDVCDFVVDNYLLDSGGKDAAAIEAFTGIGVPLSERARLNAIYTAIVLAVGQTLLTSPEAKAVSVAAVRATKP